MRKWHRWISIVAALFLLSVGITGVILQIQQFFGEDEAMKEKLATMTSAYKVDSRLDDFLPKLAKAQAVVKARTGDDKLNGMELQLKGEHATFVFHTAGKINQKFVVNADTGAIEKQSGDERESLLLRIHTGEVLGDGGVVGGMLWGTALVALTITGMWLYWQMYRARAKTKGWKKVFWLLPLAFVTAPRAFAGSPFLTDDPGFAPKGWEIKLETIYEHDKGQDVLTTPVVDINYSLTEHFKLNLTLAGKSVFPDNGSSAYGITDTDFKFKYRFLDEKPDKWWPALSIAPDVGLPTASKARGLGNGSYGFRFPVQIGKSFDKLYLYMEVGYQFVFDQKQSDSIVHGMAAQYQLTEKWNVGAELYDTIPIDKGSDYTALANLGAIYQFDEHWQLQGTIGRTLRNHSRGGPELLVQLFIQWNP